jgi:hypothetical protein
VFVLIDVLYGMPSIEQSKTLASENGFAGDQIASDGVVGIPPTCPVFESGCDMGWCQDPVYVGSNQSNFSSDEIYFISERTP